jgi:hypothetical protein
MPCCNSWDDPQTGHKRDLSGSSGHSSTDCFCCPAKVPGPTKTVVSRCSMWTSTRLLFFNSPQEAQAETVDRAAIFATRPLSRQPDLRFYLADGSSLIIEPKCPAIPAQEFSIFVNAGKALKAMSYGRKTKEVALGSPLLLDLQLIELELELARLLGVHEAKPAQVASIGLER